MDDQAPQEESPRLEPQPLTPPAGKEQFVEQPRIEPRTQETEPDKGTKLFVLFFFLLVPPLGVVILAAVCWMLFRRFMAT